MGHEQTSQTVKDCILRNVIYNGGYGLQKRYIGCYTETELSPSTVNTEGITITQHISA